MQSWRYSSKIVDMIEHSGLKWIGMSDNSLKYSASYKLFKTIKTEDYISWPMLQNTSLVS